MTSKEFYRRIEAYIPLNEASVIFDYAPDVQHVYRCTLCNVTQKSVQYVKSPLDFHGEPSLVNSCVALWFDKFTRTDFEVQFKYFKAFYNRCSTYQKELLRSSFTLNNLVSRVLYGCTE